MQDSMLKNNKMLNGALPQVVEEGNALDLQKVLDKIIKYWHWYAICCVLAVVLAWVYLRYATPGYNINAKNISAR